MLEELQGYYLTLTLLNLADKWMTAVTLKGWDFNHPTMGLKNLIKKREMNPLARIMMLKLGVDRGMALAFLFSQVFLTIVMNAPSSVDNYGYYLIGLGSGGLGMIIILHIHNLNAIENFMKKEIMRLRKGRGGKS